MASLSLSPASAAAIARLRAYVPPPASWYSLPVSRRAAVLILLFADQRGDLRVVLTMRSATLRSYAGQAALPGGKSDTIYETPLQTARREASEEIGLPMPALRPEDHRQPVTADISNDVPTDHPQSLRYSPPTPQLPAPFKIEHLCQLPTNLAKTELGVRPCVALLSSSVGRPSLAGNVETALIPRLDAKEVAAVFSGQLRGFLRLRDEDEADRRVEGEWYMGSWVDWHETRFRMHNFYVPVQGHAVTRPRRLAEPPQRTRTRGGSSSSGGGGGGSKRGKPTSPLGRIAAVAGAASAELGRQLYPRASRTIPYRDIPQPYDDDANPDPLDLLQRFRVFGMTARILVDCARIAYGEEPEFEHNSHLGDEEIIGRLIAVGKLDTERRRGDEFKGEDIVRALQGQGFGGVVGTGPTPSSSSSSSSSTDPRGRL